jgi:hypothetical protein
VSGPVQLDFARGFMSWKEARRLEDVCRPKHGGNAQSEQANDRAHPHKASMRERLENFIGHSGFEGATLRELSGYFAKPMHSLSGRISELKRDGKVFDSGREREGCAVLVGRREWVNGGAQ